MANTLVSGWKPGPQTNHEYRPDHEQHLELLLHLHDFKSVFQRFFFCKPSAWIGLWRLRRLLRRGSFRFNRRWWLKKWTLFALVVLEKSHFMMMRTGGSRCLARYPYLAPAPRAATVSPCGGSSSTPLWPIKRQSGELFKHQKDVGKPTQSLPVRTGARLFD